MWHSFRVNRSPETSEQEPEGTEESLSNVQIEVENYEIFSKEAPSLYKFAFFNKHIFIILDNSSKFNS